MPDTTLTSAELDEATAAEQAMADGCAAGINTLAKLRATGHEFSDAYIGMAVGQDAIRAYLARAGLEAGKAEESMRERAATVADDMRNKFGSRTGDAYSNGLWDQGVRIANTIRALPLTTEGGKP